MADLFSTNVLTAIVRDMRRTPGWLVRKYFPIVQTENTEEIHFDVENRPRRIAPFVSPVVAGRIVESLGFTTATFQPAYVKDKRVFDANRPMKRAMGEQIGGSLNPADRIRVLVAQELDDQIQMIDRRLEVMASESLRLGQVTVTGDEYPTKVVSYGRAAGHTITLTGGNRWGQTGIKPLDDLQTWAQLVLKATGTSPTEVTMDVNAWKLFRNDADVKERLDLRRVNDNAMSLDAQMQQGGVFQGTVDGFNIYTYSDWYVDTGGTEQPMLPANTVIMGGLGIQGVQAFGAIRDEDAGYQAMPFFPKSWVERDPSVRIMLMQSAPLVVPYRPNASLAATVN